jgi:hypothetical protein
MQMTSVFEIGTLRYPTFARIPGIVIFRLIAAMARGIISKPE